MKAYWKVFFVLVLSTTMLAACGGKNADGAMNNILLEIDNGIADTIIEGLDEDIRDVLEDDEEEKGKDQAHSDLMKVFEPLKGKAIGDMESEELEDGQIRYSYQYVLDGKDLELYFLFENSNGWKLVDVGNIPAEG